MRSYAILDIGLGAVFLDHTLNTIIGDGGSFINRKKRLILFVWRLGVIQISDQSIVEFINDKQGSLFPAFIR